MQVKLTSAQVYRLWVRTRNFPCLYDFLFQVWPSWHIFGDHWCLTAPFQSWWVVSAQVASQILRYTWAAPLRCMNLLNGLQLYRLHLANSAFFTLSTSTFWLSSKCCGVRTPFCDPQRRSWEAFSPLDLLGALFCSSLWSVTAKLACWEWRGELCWLKTCWAIFWLFCAWLPRLAHTHTYNAFFILDSCLGHSDFSSSKLHPKWLAREMHVMFRLIVVAYSRLRWNPCRGFNSYCWSKNELCHFYLESRASWVCAWKCRQSRWLTWSRNLHVGHRSTVESWIDCKLLSAGHRQ